MFPAKFAYAAPQSLQEAVGLVEDSEAKVIAGGHSLLPLMKLRLAQPKLLVDIGRIPGLSYIRVEDGVLAIGALTTYREIQLAEEVQRRAPVLAEAAHEVGDPQVQAKGTLAGSLAHADPAGDMPAVVLALGGAVRAVGPDGERDIPLDDFFVDMLTTALQEQEIIREVRLQAQQPRTGAAGPTGDRRRGPRRSGVDHRRHRRAWRHPRQPGVPGAPGSGNGAAGGA